MIIMGIDPGTVRAGYGLIRVAPGGPELLDAGIIKVTLPKKDKNAKGGAPAPTDKGLLLEEIRAGITQLCEKHRPALLAIEKLFFSKNQKTAFAVAEARGAILLAAREQRVPVQEYSPTEVKAMITGYGGADKKAVLKMVRLILRTPQLAVIDDASDALALAIVAAQNLRVSRR